MATMATSTRVSFKHILYSTDLSTPSAVALPYVLGLAKQYGAKVHALHIRYPVTYPIVGPEGMDAVMEASQEQAKLEAHQLHDMLAEVPHGVNVCEGDLWPTIRDMIGELHIDLIVTGTHGRTGVSRALLGSVAEEIFRKASCPVLTVGPHVSRNVERKLEMKEILYATDFSRESLDAIPYAVSLAQEHQARLTLLHVVEEPKVGDLVDPELHKESMLRRLRNLVPTEADQWCEPRFWVAHGKPAEKIMETAIAIGADLMVLGIRNVGGNLGATTHLLRPTAHQVIAQAECPVLTVRG